MWRELRGDSTIAVQAPWDDVLAAALLNSPLTGNFRDLRRLALLCMAWKVPLHGAKSLDTAIREWAASRDAATAADGPRFYEGTREERTRAFQRDLAAWANEAFTTVEALLTAVGRDGNFYGACDPSLGGDPILGPLALPVRYVDGLGRTNLR